MEKSTKIDRTTLIGFKNQAAKIRFFFNPLTLLPQPFFPLLIFYLLDSETEGVKVCEC